MHPSRQARIRSLLTPSLESGDVTINLNMVEDPLNEDEKAIEAASAEADMQEDDVDQLEETGVALESFYEEVKTSYDNGGMSPATARMLARGLEFHYNRIGVEHTSVSVEGFEDATTRREVTRVSLESIGDKINKVWEALKTAIRKAITAIMDFFAKIFSGFETLKKRASALKVSAEKAKSTKGGKIEVSDATWITVEGKIAPKLAADNVLKAINYIYGDYRDYLKNVYKFFGRHLGDNKSTDEEIKDDWRKQKLGLSYSVTMDVAGNAGITTVGLIGGTAAASTADNDRMWEIAYCDIFYMRGKIPTTKEGVDALLPQDIVGIANAVIAIAETAMSKRETLKGVKADLEEMIATIDTADKKQGHNFVKRAHNRHAMRVVSPKVTAVFNRVNKLAFDVARATLAVGEKSLAFHQGK